MNRPVVIPPFACLLFLAVMLAWQPTFSQTQFDPARAAAAVPSEARSEALIREQREAASAGLEQENLFAPATPGDSDMGRQLILKRHEKSYPFTVLADSGGFWTNNAANVSQGEIEDWFYVGGVAAAWQHRLKSRYYGDAFLSQHWYRYDELDVLDYEAGQAGAGLLVLMPELAHTILHLHYYYQRITQGIDESAIYETHNIRVGAQKTFLIDRLNSINVGLLASLAMDTEPDVLQRHEYTLHLGYNFKIMRELVFSMAYRFTYFDYFNLDGREDLYHNAGVNLTWQPVKHLEISAGYNYTVNESNRDVFDYQSQLAGPSLAIKFKF